MFSDRLRVQREVYRWNNTENIPDKCQGVYEGLVATLVPIADVKRNIGYAQRSDNLTEFEDHHITASEARVLLIDAFVRPYRVGNHCVQTHMVYAQDTDELDIIEVRRLLMSQGMTYVSGDLSDEEVARVKALEREVHKKRKPKKKVKRKKTKKKKK